MRFRHFTGLGRALDDDINSWLQAESPDVELMSQTQVPDGAITVCFVYQEGFAAQERRMSAEHGLRETEPARLAPEPIHVESEGVG
jgi:hypothetical protein